MQTPGKDRNRVEGSGKRCCCGTWDQRGRPENGLSYWRFSAPSAQATPLFGSGPAPAGEVNLASITPDQLFKASRTLHASTTRHKKTAAINHHHPRGPLLRVPSSIGSIFLKTQLHQLTVEIRLLTSRVNSPASIPTVCPSFAEQRRAVLPKGYLPIQL
jgi:hypothetical protein